MEDLEEEVALLARATKDVACGARRELRETEQSLNRVRETSRWDVDGFSDALDPRGASSEGVRGSTFGYAARGSPLTGMDPSTPGPQTFRPETSFLSSSRRRVADVTYRVSSSMPDQTPDPPGPALAGQDSDRVLRPRVLGGVFGRSGRMESLEDVEEDVRDVGGVVESSPRVDGSVAMRFSARRFFFSGEGGRKESGGAEALSLEGVERGERALGIGTVRTAVWRTKENEHRRRSNWEPGPGSYDVQSAERYLNRSEGTSVRYVRPSQREDKVEEENEDFSTFDGPQWRKWAQRELVNRAMGKKEKAVDNSSSHRKQRHSSDKKVLRGLEATRLRRVVGGKWSDRPRFASSPPKSAQVANSDESPKPLFDDDGHSIGSETSESTISTVDESTARRDNEWSRRHAKSDTPDIIQPGLRPYILQRAKRSGTKDFTVAAETSTPEEEKLVDSDDGTDLEMEEEELQEIVDVAKGRDKQWLQRYIAKDKAAAWIPSSSDEEEEFLVGEEKVENNQKVRDFEVGEEKVENNQKVQAFEAGEEKEDDNHPKKVHSVSETEDQSVWDDDILSTGLWGAREEGEEEDAAKRVERRRQKRRLRGQKRRALQSVRPMEGVEEDRMMRRRMFSMDADEDTKKTVAWQRWYRWHRKKERAEGGPLECETPKYSAVEPGVPGTKIVGGKLPQNTSLPWSNSVLREVERVLASVQHLGLSDHESEPTKSTTDRAGTWSRSRRDQTGTRDVVDDVGLAHRDWTATGGGVSFPRADRDAGRRKSGTSDKVYDTRQAWEKLYGTERGRVDFAKRVGRGDDDGVEEEEEELMLENVEDLRKRRVIGGVIPRAEKEQEAEEDWKELWGGDTPKLLRRHASKGRWPVAMRVEDVSVEDETMQDLVDWGVSPRQAAREVARQETYAVLASLRKDAKRPSLQVPFTSIPSTSNAGPVPTPPKGGSFLKHESPSSPSPDYRAALHPTTADTHLFRSKPQTADWKLQPPRWKEYDSVAPPNVTDSEAALELHPPYFSHRAAIGLGAGSIQKPTIPTPPLPRPSLPPPVGANPSFRNERKALLKPWTPKPNDSQLPTHHQPSPPDQNYAEDLIYDVLDTIYNSPSNLHH